MKAFFFKEPLFKKIGSRRYQMPGLILLWAVVQTILLFTTGVQPILESTKYINEAKTLLETGWFSAPRFLFYGFTPIIIAICLKLQWGFAGVVFLQLLANFCATFYLYSVLYKQQLHKFAAFATTALLILCLPYQTWNFYLYTESFFYSNSLLFVASCICNNPLKRKQILVQLLFLIMSVFSRPLGILFLPCWIIYLILHTDSKQVRHWLTSLFIVAVLIFAFIVNKIMSTINDWQILSSAAQNQLICDMPGNRILNLEAFANQPPLQQLLSYIANYPTHFLSLAAKRMYLFFSLSRAYYSKVHNLLLALLNIILYAPIILSLFRSSIYNYFSKEIIFCTLTVVSFSLSAALQCDDYHNRFHNTLIPVFLYMGVFKLLNLYSKKETECRK